MNTDQLFDMWMEYNFGETGDGWVWTSSAPKSSLPQFKWPKELDFVLYFQIIG